MNYEWKKPGDMSAKVEDYAPKMKQYSGQQPGKTTEYIARRNKIQDEQASKLGKQRYMGRYE